MENMLLLSAGTNRNQLELPWVGDLSLKPRSLLFQRFWLLSAMRIIRSKKAEDSCADRLWRSGVFTVQGNRRMEWETKGGEQGNGGIVIHMALSGENIWRWEMVTDGHRETISNIYLRYFLSAAIWPFIWIRQLTCCRTSIQSFHGP